MENLVMLLGILLAGAAFLAVVLRSAGQSSIIVFIAVGVVAGFFREQFHIPHDMVEPMKDFGVIQTEELAAQRLGQLLREHDGSLGALAEEGRRHRESLVAASRRAGFGLC